MNITAMLYAAVRGFRGPGPDDSNGAAGLAPFMGLTSTSLNHKVSPSHSAHCSPEEVVQICRLTSDANPIRAMAWELGFALLPIAPAGEGAAGAELTRGMTVSIKEFGEFVSEVANKSAAEGVSDNDMARIDREFAEHMAASAHLYSLIKARHKSGQQPRSVVSAAPEMGVPA